MALSTGDILAIVFGSLLLLVIIGYLIYYMMFRKNKTVTLQDIEKYIRNNPNNRNQVINMLKTNTTNVSSKSTMPVTSPETYDDKILTETANTTPTR